jgi:hypothetical protein
MYLIQHNMSVARDLLRIVDEEIEEISSGTKVHVLPRHRLAANTVANAPTRAALAKFRCNTPCQRNGCSPPRLRCCHPHWHTTLGSFLHKYLRHL